MTVAERAEATLYLGKIEQALTAGSEAHAAFVLLRGLVGEIHGAQDHAPRRGRKPKTVPELGGSLDTTRAPREPGRA